MNPGCITQSVAQRSGEFGPVTGYGNDGDGQRNLSSELTEYAGFYGNNRALTGYSLVLS
jgi:hypothetical protein